jgi:N,N'-diacetyllegionaminate synthase
MISINGRKVGDGHPCFVTFEAGPTHSGIESAKRLIKHAADSGADAIKFQIFDPDKLVADKNQLFSFGVLKNRDTGEIEEIEKPLYDILVERCMTAPEWKLVKKYSDELGLAFFATVGFESDIELLEKLGCHSIKIGSADINHHPLLRRAAKTGMVIQIDTGMATLGEIELAVDVIRSEGNENIIIHQCPSGYPARIESINLKTITTLKKMFSYPVAYSDHTPGYEMDVAAIALGANLVEKTITEDRMTRAVEHLMSIEPHEMSSFIKTIRDVELAMGSDRRKMSEDEIENRNKIRRSIFLLKDAKKGQKISECDIEFRRPGFGISPDQYELVADATMKADTKAEHMVCMKDLVF